MRGHAVAERGGADGVEKRAWPQDGKMPLHPVVDPRLIVTTMPSSGRASKRSPVTRTGHARGGMGTRAWLVSHRALPRSAALRAAASQPRASTTDGDQLLDGVAFSRPAATHVSLPHRLRHARLRRARGIGAKVACPDSHRRRGDRRRRLHVPVTSWPRRSSTGSDRLPRDDDERFGAIKYLQDAMFASTRVIWRIPDFPAMARAFGAAGERVADLDALPRALERAFEARRPDCPQLPLALDLPGSCSCIIRP